MTIEQKRAYYSLGGPTELSNLQALCKPCNRGKYVWSRAEYVAHCRKVVEAQEKIEVNRG